jgi:hypothetical protein
MLFLAVLQAVFFEAMPLVDAGWQRFELAWLAIKFAKPVRFRLARALRPMIRAALVEATPIIASRRECFERIWRGNTVIDRDRNRSDVSGQGSSLRMMYLVRRASLRNIILRLRGLALPTPILPVVCIDH